MPPEPLEVAVERPHQSTRHDARTVGIVVLATIAVIAALYLGRLFFVPIVFAAMLNAVLRPVVRRIERLHVPAWVGAAIVVLGLLAALAAGGFALSLPLRTWVAEAPKSLEKAGAKLARLREPVKQVTDAVARAGDGAGGSPTTSPSQPPAPAAPSPVGTFVSATSEVLGGAAEVLLLLYLLLAGGGMFLDKLVKVLPRFPQKQLAEEIVHESESVVLRYLVVNFCTNLGQGIVIAALVWWIGLPTPLLWGLFTVVLEFVPYLGATVMILLLAVTGFATFDGVGHALLAHGGYLVVATLQNNLVSPIAYGRRLKLNPVAVLLGVLFWWFVWGIPGAFLAVPIVATFKIAADRTERLRPLGVFLGE